MFGSYCENCLDIPDIICSVHCDRADSPEALIEDMRRYLYRNVACECRKGQVYLRMPKIPGWT